jgi:hypothetical protein
MTTRILSLCGEQYKLPEDILQVLLSYNPGFKYFIQPLRQEPVLQGVKQIKFMITTPTAVADFQKKRQWKDIPVWFDSGEIPLRAGYAVAEDQIIIYVYSFQQHLPARLKKAVFVPPVINLCFHLFYMTYFYRERKGLVLHGAAIHIQEKCLVFLGDSGDGKTTSMNLANEYFGPGHIVNDERLFILPKKKGCLIYGTPFVGVKSRIAADKYCQNIAVTCTATQQNLFFFRLKKAKCNKVYKASVRDQGLVVMAQALECLQGFKGQFKYIAMHRALSLLTHYYYRVFCFRKNVSAMRYLERVVLKR